MLGLQSWFCQELHIMRPLTSLSDRQAVRVYNLKAIKVNDKPTNENVEQTEEVAMTGTSILA